MVRCLLLYDALVESDGSNWDEANIYGRDGRVMAEEKNTKSEATLQKQSFAILCWVITYFCD
jgi:hypothetical protein